MFEVELGSLAGWLAWQRKWHLVNKFATKMRLPGNWEEEAGGGGGNQFPTREHLISHFVCSSSLSTSHHHDHCSTLAQTSIPSPGDNHSFDNPLGILEKR